MPTQNGKEKRQASFLTCRFLRILRCVSQSPVWQTHVSQIVRGCQVCVGEQFFLFGRGMGQSPMLLA